MTPKQRLQEAIASQELDMEMLPFIHRINNLPEFESLYCCSGHNGRAPGYILFKAPEPEPLVQKLKIAYRKRDWPSAPIPKEDWDLGIEIPYAVIGPSMDDENTINLSFNTLEELSDLIGQIENETNKKIGLGSFGNP